ncbi:methyltransferase family protein [Leptolyngbya sp. PCC 7375]|nr:methyltransferase family protein [Leptolyngbya sp. PCC 7375]
MNFSNEEQILHSWQQNAIPWTVAVREQQIESRQLVTNQAIVETVMSYSPQTVLDIGCGEGWLARALHAHNITVHGVDGIPALVNQARARGDGRFDVMSYEEISAGKWQDTCLQDTCLQNTFDVVVCNFSLFGNESVAALLQQVPTLLSPGGHLMIQTLHPLMACGDQPYKDGWRAGSWASFSQDFVDPAPWYFRTMASWIGLLSKSGLVLQALIEPLHPKTGKPASVIFACQSNRIFHQ